MHVPFLDLSAQLRSIRAEVDAAIGGVLDSTRFILGPEVSGFESEFAAAHERTFGVTTNSGTSALHLALWALGIGRGDEVIVPVNTFIATAEAVLLTGATPVFVDHDDAFGLDAEKLESAFHGRTRCVIPVHLYGQLANMSAIAEVAGQHGALIVEDAAQAHLGRLGDKSVGSWSSAACFSFYPGKNLGAIGEGGAVLTDNEELVRTMLQLRDHGSSSKYVHERSGHNYRLEALQAAVLRVKLRHLATWTAQRQSRAALYDSLLASIPEIATPKVRAGAEHVYHLYVIQAERRDELREFLQERGIDTGMHYPIPLHQQQAFADLGYKTGAFPVAEQSAKRILSLPMYPELGDDAIHYVVETIASFYGQVIS